MKTKRITHDIEFSDDPAITLRHFLDQKKSGTLFIITDSITKKHCYPSISEGLPGNTKVIQVSGGEKEKSIDSIVKIWQKLIDHRADKNSLILNLGGGTISDLGGFAAASYKRGISFINVPTTLLAMVDAALGGKTGINFSGLKNAVGAFYFPETVIIVPAFLSTLPRKQILAGFAEIIKHALIADNTGWKKLKNIDLSTFNSGQWADIIKRSAGVKMNIVNQDPLEKGLRMALNFGHTFGHAYESYYSGKGKPVTHGLAVAFGIVYESLLSTRYCGLSVTDFEEIKLFVEEKYGSLKINGKDYDGLYDQMTHDKKNEFSQVKFTLLTRIGEFKVNITCTKKDIYYAFDFFNKKNHIFRKKL